jgi:hypothetical protein
MIKDWSSPQLQEVWKRDVGERWGSQQRRQKSVGIRGSPIQRMHMGRNGWDLGQPIPLRIDIQPGPGRPTKAFPPRDLFLLTPRAFSHFSSLLFFSRSPPVRARRLSCRHLGDRRRRPTLGTQVFVGHFAATSTHQACSSLLFLPAVRNRTPEP